MPRQQFKRTGNLRQVRAEQNEGEQKYYESKKFKQLQDKWYKKAEKSGFEEQEDVNSSRELMKEWHSSHFMKDIVVDKYEDQQRFFELARQLLHIYPFRTNKDRRIWELFSDGIMIRGISREVHLSEYRIKKFTDELCKLIIKDAKETLDDIDRKKKTNA